MKDLVVQRQRADARFSPEEDDVEREGDREKRQAASLGPESEAQSPCHPRPSPGRLPGRRPAGSPFSPSLPSCAVRVPILGLLDPAAAAREALEASYAAMAGSQASK